MSNIPRLAELASFGENALHQMDARTVAMIKKKSEHTSLPADRPVERASRPAAVEQGEKLETHRSETAPGE